MVNMVFLFTIVYFKPHIIEGINQTNGKVLTHPLWLLDPKIFVEIFFEIKITPSVFLSPKLLCSITRLWRHSLQFCVLIIKWSLLNVWFIKILQTWWYYFHAFKTKKTCFKGTMTTVKLIFLMYEEEPAFI